VGETKGAQAHPSVPGPSTAPRSLREQCAEDRWNPASLDGFLKLALASGQLRDRPPRKTRRDWGLDWSLRTTRTTGNG